MKLESFNLCAVSLFIQYLRFIETIEHAVIVMVIVHPSPDRDATRTPLAPGRGVGGAGGPTTVRSACSLASPVVRCGRVACCTVAPRLPPSPRGKHVPLRQTFRIGLPNKYKLSNVTYTQLRCTHAVN